jgi:hypothetical protein
MGAISGVDETGIGQAMTRAAITGQIENLNLDPPAPPVKGSTSPDIATTKSEGAPAEEQGQFVESSGTPALTTTLDTTNTSGIPFSDPAKPAEDASVIGKTHNIVDQHPGTSGIDFSSASKPVEETFISEQPPAAATTTGSTLEPLQQTTESLNNMGGKPDKQVSEEVPPEAIKKSVQDFLNNGSDFSTKTSIETKSEEQHPDLSNVAAAVAEAKAAPPEVEGKATLPLVFDAPVAAESPPEPTPPTPKEEVATQKTEEQVPSSTLETQDEKLQGLYDKFVKTLKENGGKFIEIGEGSTRRSVASSPDGSKILIDSDEKQNQSEST